jgi:hypothetical protein
VDKGGLVSLSVKVFGLILLSTWALFLPGNAWAQYTTGGVQGTVLDSSGAVVKDAIVTLHSRETNAVRTFTTGADGVYLFAAVPPGYYALTAEASGFLKSSASILTTSNASVGANLTLSVAGQGTTVTVQDLAGANFNTTDPQLATTRSAAEVDDLPIQGWDLTTKGRNLAGPYKTRPWPWAEKRLRQVVSSNA